MKITILMGSPNRNGSTSILTDEFKRGAEEAGHQENEELIAALDSVYGSGSAKYIGEAIESFYTSPSKIFQ